MTEAIMNPTAEQIKTQAEFQEKMKERMRTAMGDLMPDAVLADIVAKGIDEAFFKRVEYRNQWGSVDRTEPSWCAAFIREELKGRIKIEVEKWCKDNGDKLMKSFDELFQKGIANAVMDSMMSIFRGPVDALRNSVQEAFRKLNTNANIY